MDILKQLKKKYESLELEPACWVPSGIFAVDYLTNNRGIPAGRLVEIVGEVSVGKSITALYILSIIQKIKGAAIYIDFEHTFNKEFAEKVAGFDTENALILQPEYLEDAFKIIIEITQDLKKVSNDKLIGFVIDSIAAAPLKSEVEDLANTQNNIAEKARMLSLMLRKITSFIDDTKIVLVFVNQFREKIGSIFGHQYVIPGGLSISYHSSLIIEIKKVHDIKSQTNICGYTLKYTAIKNKLNIPYKSAVVDFYFNKGFDNSQSIMEYLVQEKVLEKSAGWYKYKQNSFRSYQLSELIKKHPDVLDIIKSKIPNFDYYDIRKLVEETENG